MLGVSAEIDKIKKIASRKNIVVIDDNCEALGSKWKGKTLGNQFDMCAWSFDSGKTITTGEGGMITTNQKKFYKFCLEYRDHGHENNPKYPRGRETHSIYGFNYRVSEIVGALGLVQLQKLPTVVKNNKNRYKIYEDVLKKYSNLKLRKIPKNNIPLKDCIIFNLKNKTIANKVLLEIKKQNIVTKNLPDAIEWHFAKYWDHIFKKYKITKRQLLNNFPKSSDYLERSIAIFIYTTEKLSEVKKKAKILDNILKLSLNEKKI